MSCNHTSVQVQPVFNVGSSKNFLVSAVYSYPERLYRLHLQRLELRRLLTDLVWCFVALSI